MKHVLASFSAMEDRESSFHQCVRSCVARASLLICEKDLMTPF